MLRTLVTHVDKLKYIAGENAPTIFTAIGVVGTVATAVLTGRATVNAVEVINDAEVIEDRKFSKTEKVKFVWPHYFPPFVTGVITIGSIITANRISSKKIAALTIAATVSERAFTEYKEKVIERLGNKQDEKLRDEIAQDRVNRTPLGSQVLISNTGEVLCFDSLTGRYFSSTMEDIKRAENRVNYEMLRFNSCSLSYFYEEIGLQPTSYSDTVGWGVNNPMEVKFSTVLSEDSRPCLVIDFSRAPTSDYEKNW